MNAELAAHPDHATIRQVIDQIVRQNISMRASIDSTSYTIRQQTNEIVALRSDLNRKESEALTDELTGIGNRRYLTGRLQLEMKHCKLGAAPLSIILIDLDRFKSINDIHGHEAGDHVLQAFVRILAVSIKSRDTFARYGGEEFIILLPDTELSKAHAVAERLRMKLAGKV
jgi:PleD family two-component response regulator